MNRALVLAILIYSLLILGLSTLNRGLLALSTMLIVYLFSGLLFGNQEFKLKIRRQIIPERANSGTPVDIKISIINEGSHMDEVFFEDRVPQHLEVLEGDTNLLTELPVHGELEFSYTVRSRRGIYKFQEVRTTVYDFLGLFKQLQVIPIEGQLFVPPKISKLKHINIRPRMTRVYSGIVPARLGGQGVEFFGLRTYHPGDSLNRINWKASARNPGSLFSNEFEQERVADVGLIVDARERSNIKTPSGTLFEHQVSASAAIANTLLNDGNRVGLLIFGGYIDWIFPGYGKLQHERINQALARARTGVSMVFAKLKNLPTRVFPYHSQLILVTSLMNDDIPFLIQLRARGYQVMIISPNAIDYQEKWLPETESNILGARIARVERSLMFTKLKHAGIYIINWDVAVPFDQAMQVALTRTPPWVHPFGGRL